jgi:LCP family protein required for cell wall assembly
VTMKVYKAGRRSGRGGERWGGVLRWVLLVLLALVALVLVYLLVPFGGPRAVLLGSDARAEEASRSDTIVVAKAGEGMLVVPRDTLVEIPGVGEDKINAAFAVGGPELTVETLEDFTGVPIGNYIVVHFDGVEEIVNALGGITLEIRQPMRVGIEGKRYSIPPGTQTLNGGEALAYVRYRGGPAADIGRIGRQQRFLRELVQESTSLKKLHRLPATMLVLWRNSETNMNPLEAVRFALQMRLWGGIEAETYPGTPLYIGGISYWVPDRGSGERVVEETIE